MGIGNKIPGVSGGTVSFVLGFYGDLIYSLQKLNLKALKLLISFRFASFYRYINGAFLFPLLVGSLISYFGFSFVLDYLINHFEIYVWACFFGMVLASVVLIVRDYDQWNRVNIFSAILGTSLGISLLFVSQGTENDNLFYVFICGIIGVSGMTLPGLSGSFILMLMGNYVLLMVDSVNVLSKTLFQIIQLDFSFMSRPEQLDSLLVIFMFGLGSFAGLIMFSNLLSFVLKRFYNRVIAIIIGFILGSLAVVWPWKQKVYQLDQNGVPLEDDRGDLIIRSYKQYLPDWSSSETLYALLTIAIAFSLIFLIEYIAKKIRRT
jgi:uncharacterized membrane protein